VKVIKTFGFDHTSFTLPTYDGSHDGNVDAWLRAVGGMRFRDPDLNETLLDKIAQFRNAQTNEMDIVSTLLQQRLRYDVQVIWRRRRATLRIFSLTPFP
jgi:hypothetical protein